MNMRQLSELLEAHKDKIIIEDTWGRKYNILSVRAIGTKTDDPGLVIKIENNVKGIV